MYISECVLTSFLGGFPYFYSVTDPQSQRNLSDARGISSLLTKAPSSLLVSFANDPTEALRYGKLVFPNHILETLADWCLYGHVTITFLSMIVIAPMNTYAPSIIKSLGSIGLQANGLNSVGFVCALL
jgi:hypothetical protein